MAADFAGSSAVRHNRRLHKPRESFARCANPMAFDAPSPQQADRRLSIVPYAGGWAIKHGDGFLGMSACREEAMRLLRTLEDAADDEVSRRPR
jgi:hypothetical protein